MFDELKQLLLNELQSAINSLLKLFESNNSEHCDYLCKKLKAINLNCTDDSTLLMQINTMLAIGSITGAQQLNSRFFTPAQSQSQSTFRLSDKSHFIRVVPDCVQQAWFGCLSKAYLLQQLLSADSELTVILTRDLIPQPVPTDIANSVAECLRHQQDILLPQLQQCLTVNNATQVEVHLRQFATDWSNALVQSVQRANLSPAMDSCPSTLSLSFDNDSGANTPTPSLSRSCSTGGG